MIEPTVIQPTVPRDPELDAPPEQHVSVLADQVAKRPSVITPPAAVTNKNITAVAPITTTPPISVVTSDQAKTPAAIPLSQLQNELQRSQKAKSNAIVSSSSNSALEFNLVVLQLLAILFIIIGFFPALLWQNTLLQIIGVLFVGIGIFVGIWAVLTFKQKIRILPSPSDTSFLVTGGPFAFVRHPMYVALLFFCIGLTLAFPTVPRIIALIVLIIVLRVKMGYEEKLLAKRFSGYDKYKKHTGKLIPKFTKSQ